MTKIETLISAAKDTLISHQLNVVGRSRLGAAIEEAESARAAFCDVRNNLSSIIDAINRTLETGDNLAFHAFTDNHYSKGITWCAAVRFRTAWRELEAAKARAENEIAEFRTLLNRHYHSTAC